MRIGKKTIGPGKPVFIVAELSGNHNGDIKRALKIIDAAALAGADAIKLQTYTADTITINSNAPDFRLKWKGKHRTLHSLYGEAATSWEWHARLFAYAKKRGLICFSTPFDDTAVAFLEKLHAPVYKVASFEVVDIPLLETIGKTKKPVIMSRGMATLPELALAVKTLRKFGTKEIVLLQCVSAYPAAPEDMHLANIPDLHKRFRTVVGLSDHTLGVEAALASVALGACIIEKHLTLHRADGGPDATFSLEPDEFRAMVASVRTVEKAIGRASYARGTSERAMVPFRKSLFVVADMRKGERFTKGNVRSIRPGTGLPPKWHRSVLGKRAARDIARGTPLAHILIQK